MIVILAFTTSFKWKERIHAIDAIDQRISNSLDDAKISVDNKTIIINIDELDNSYIQKTLNDNKDLIQGCIFKVLYYKFDIEIKSNFKDKEENPEIDHPLLDNIKEKFNN